MQTITPDDPRYDAARALFNVAIDRRPAVIARCSSPGDVVDALAHARDRGLDVAVRSGGHSVSGSSSNDGGLVVDVRPMDRITVDPDARTLRAGAGVTWGDVDAATQAHGLAVTGGRATSTGIAGFTLGGGDGWLARPFGLACDNLLGVDLVTADGREVHASADENPELFWALHGGGGNFGVATRFQLRLHPLGPQVLAGLAGWPLDDVETVREVARTFRDLMDGAPDALGAGMLIMNAPEEVPGDLAGQPVVLLAVCYAGDAAEGREVLRPILDLAPPLDLVDVMPYTQFQELTTDPPGFRHYWSADYHDAVDDDALELVVDHGRRRPSPLCQQVLFAWGGAIARVPDGATPLAQRHTAWVTHPFGVWDDPADDAACVEWVRSFRRAIADHASGGVYLNFIGAEGEDRVRAAFGDATYARLQQVKGRYDPDNVFRGNQNIRPA